MEKKINIAKILNDCPKCMELDCTMYDNLVFCEIDSEAQYYPIITQLPNGVKKWFTSDGRYELNPNAKCVIFPKGKTTWEGFQRPFEDGDVVTYKYENGLVSMILNKFVNFVEVHYYCALYNNAKGFITNNYIVGEPKYTRFATEEEKQKLFQAIKDNGYKWNSETKTLEKLVEPKFKVGDIITKRDSIENSWVVSSVSSEYYGLQLPKGSEGIGTLPIIDQDKYELIPNKFDITTLKPFESKVLVRNSDVDSWCPAIFGCKRTTHTLYTYATMTENYYAQCIPYERNEHLLGTTNDCEEFYKTWK